MPSVIHRNCHTCGKEIEAVMASLGMMNHPSCDGVIQDLDLVEPPKAAFTPVPVEKYLKVPAPDIAKAVKDELVTMLIWSEHHKPRSTQANIGPSELGVACDRQLAYRVAGIGERGTDAADIWAAFVGSAIHDRIEDAIRAYLAAHPMAPKWNIEERVQADPLIKGRADLNRDNLLVDVKSAGNDKLEEVKKQGPPRRYRVQQHTYAKALRDMGRPIEYICLFFVPRSGLLRNSFVWAEPYDEVLALESIQRPYKLGQRLMELDVLNNPKRWNDIPATPTYECQYCPLWNKYLPPELGADNKGCPGYQSSTREKE